MKSLRITAILALVCMACIARADGVADVNSMLDNIQNAHASRDIDLLGAQYSDEVMLVIGERPDFTPGAFLLDKEKMLNGMRLQTWQADNLQTRVITNRRIVVKNDLAFIRMTVNDTFKDAPAQSSEQFVIAVRRDSKWTTCFAVPAVMKGEALITKVQPGSEAARLQLKAGDIILECNGQRLDPLLSGSDLKSILKPAGATEVNLLIRRPSADTRIKASPGIPGATVEATLIPTGAARYIGPSDPHPVKDLLKQEISILKSGDASGYTDIMTPLGFFSYRREPGKPVTLVSADTAPDLVSKQVKESRAALKPATVELGDVSLIATDNIAIAEGAIRAQERSGSPLDTLTRLQVFARRDDQWRMVADLVERYRLAPGDSLYRSADETSKAEQNMSGKLTGIGVSLDHNAAGILITKLLPGAPAEKANLLVGEIITSVDGKSAKDMTLQQAVAAITGPEGTQVTLEVLDSSGTSRTVKITRQTISVPSIEARVMDGGIGFLRIATFNAETPAAVRDVLTSSLSPKNARGIVLDLRGCAGGLLDKVTDVAEMFVPGNPPQLLWVIRQGTKDPVSVQTKSPAATSLPCVVLIDGKTAGAGELLAETLKEHSCKLVGAQTAGEATVKQVVKNPDGSSRTAQIGHFLFPKTARTGTDPVMPDVTAPSDATPEQVFALGIDTLRKQLPK